MTEWKHSSEIFPVFGKKTENYFN